MLNLYEHLMINQSITTDEAIKSKSKKPWKAHLKTHYSSVITESSTCVTSHAPSPCCQFDHRAGP